MGARETLSCVLGVGLDMVCVREFATDLAQPGSTFARVFSVGEREDAASRPQPGASLAARWAAKEAFVKAWCQAISPHDPPLPDDPEIWSQIEVVTDAVHRPRIVLSYQVRQAWCTAGLDACGIHVSLTHDGPGVFGGSGGRDGQGLLGRSSGHARAGGYEACTHEPHVCAWASALVVISAGNIDEYARRALTLA